MLQTFYQNTRWFLILFFLLMIAGSLFLIISRRGELVLFINAFSNSVLDRFFLRITDLGLGGFVAICGGVLLLFNYRWSLLVLVSLAWVGIFTNIFKRLLFTGKTRPLHYFYYDDFPRFIHDVPLTYYHSFPSGHSMTIFAFCSMLAYLFGGKITAVLLFVLAVLVQVSRIYLLQHFEEDVLAGAFLGVTSTFITVMLLDGKIRLHQRAPFQKGILNLIPAFWK